MNDVSGNFEPHIAYDEDDIHEYYNEVESSEEVESSVYSDSSVDYSSHFENLEIIGILIFCIIFGSCLALSFIKGFNK